MSSIKSPVLRIEHPLVDTNGELVVDYEKTLIEQSVDVRAQEKTVPDRVATLVAHALDVRCLKYIALLTTGHRAPTFLDY